MVDKIIKSFYYFFMDCIYRHNNIYRNIILFFSIIFIIISCKNDVGLLIVVPNNYIGEFYIIEDKKKYQEPDIKAFENFGVYEYRLNGNEIKVKDIKIFERQKIELSYDWVEPIKDDKIFTKWENSKILKIIVIENKSLSCFLCK